MDNDLQWTPKEQLRDKVWERKILRGWKLTKYQVDKFASELPTQVHPMKPIGVNLWLGHDLKYNWKEAIIWLADSIEGLEVGLEFEDLINSDELSFCPGSEQSGEPYIESAILDLDTYFGVNEKLLVSELRSAIPKRRPGLIVPNTLALNPQVYKLSGCNKCPPIIATGIEYQKNKLVCFGGVLIYKNYYCTELVDHGYLGECAIADFG